MADVTSLQESVSSLLKVPSVKSAKIPKQIISQSKNRNGLSVTEITSTALSKLADKGYHVGTHIDGTPDMMGDMIQIVIESIITAIQNDAKITVSIDPGLVVSTPLGPGLTSDWGIGGGIIQ